MKLFLVAVLLGCISYTLCAETTVRPMTKRNPSSAKITSSKPMSSTNTASSTKPSTKSSAKPSSKPSAKPTKPPVTTDSSQTSVSPTLPPSTGSSQNVSTPKPQKTTPNGSGSFVPSSVLTVLLVLAAFISLKHH